MMKRKVVLVLCLFHFFNNVAYSKTRKGENNTDKNNIISAEIGGLGIFYTIQYTRLITTKKFGLKNSDLVNFSIGTSAYSTFVTLPISARYLWKVNAKDHYIELGIGAIPQFYYSKEGIRNATLKSDQTFLIEGAIILGYRYLAKNYTFHINLNPSFLFDGSILTPRIAVGAGFRF